MKRIVLTIATTTLLAVPQPAGFAEEAQAACSIGSGGFGADAYLVAGVTVGYTLVAYAELPGCVTGFVDVVAQAIPGTPGTCTFVLPQTPDGPGATCSTLYTPNGVGIATSEMVLEAAGAAIGPTGTIVPIVGACSGQQLGNSPGGTGGPRCDFN